MFPEINPTEQMVQKAGELNEGKILIVYKDHNAIRMETETGTRPYVWRNDEWRVMRLTEGIT